MVISNFRRAGNSFSQLDEINCFFHDQSKGHLVYFTLGTVTYYYIIFEDLATSAVHTYAALRFFSMLGATSCN